MDLSAFTVDSWVERFVACKKEIRSFLVFIFNSRMNMTTSNILRHLLNSPLPGFGCFYIPLPVYILGAQQLLLLPSASDEITIRSVQLKLSWLDLLPKKLREFGTPLSFKKNHSNEI